MYDNLTKTNLEFAHREAEKRIAKLEKENEDLREQHYADCEIVDKIYGLFTKAKELLTRFVMASVYFNGKETDLVEEAEQFLEDV